VSLAARLPRAGRVSVLIAAACMLIVALGMPVARAETPSHLLEVHGSTDAFAAPGVALAWGVLRGSSETASAVIIRVVADPDAYRFVSMTASNPFSGRTDTLLPATAIGGAADLRVARGRFAELPRTELRFFTDEASMRADAPALVVFYLGVPDTTPEFADASTLSSDVDVRITRVRKGRSP